MKFDLDKAEDILNSISLDLIMISPENLVDISELLGKVEPLAEAFAPLDSDLPAKIINALKEGLTAIIQGRITDGEKAVALVGEGLSMLQELARSLPVNAPFKGDIDAWTAAFEGLATAEGLLAEDEAAFESDEGAFADGPPPAAAPEPLRDNAPSQFSEDSTIASDGNGPDGPLTLNSTGEFHEGGLGQGPAAISVDNFKKEFIAEVEEIQVLLVAAEQKNDPQSTLSELTRNFRSILSAATLLQLPHMALLAHNSIGLIEYVAADHVPYSTAITDILLKTCDYFLKELGGLELTDDGEGWRVDPKLFNTAEVEAFADQLWLARQGVLTAVSTQAAATSGAHQPPKPKKIGEILVEKGLISEGDLGGLIEAQQNARKLTLGEILVAEKKLSPEELEKALAQQAVTPDKRLGDILVSSGVLDIEEIEDAIKRQEEKRETKLGEFLVKSKIGAPEKVAIALREQKQSEAATKGGGQQQVAQTVKVETVKLDGLIDLVGELVIAQSLITANEQVANLKEQKISKDLAHVSRITSELQRNAMSLRMVQIRQTFQKMNRLVRDLAHRFEKDIRFDTVGGDTEIDRNMVESIYDPLVHLVRNSVDHGLEPPDERRAAGKPPQGVLTLKAYHQGGNVVIEVIDDGRGLDVARVREKAVERGLISAADDISDAAVHALVFQAGFSTAETVSDISGRGVGMDVVKKSIEKLRGKVDFASKPGRGSTMTIRLPLTLAIIDGMIVRVGEHRYILPTISIVESFRPVITDYYTVKGQGEMIKVRNHMLPLMRLDRIVGAGGALSNPEEALVVVIENEGEPRCLLVDEVLGKQEVVIKSLGERLKYVRALAGGTILGDGRVGLILDVAGLFEMSGDMGGAFPATLNAADDFDDDWGMGD